MKPIAIAVAGAMGRMGQAILNQAFKQQGISVQGGIESVSHPNLGEDLGLLLKQSSLGIHLTDQPSEALRSADVLISFSTPKGTLEHVRACMKLKKKMVIGTTGFSKKEQGFIRSAAKKIAVVQAPNMSVGVNLLFTLAKMAASKLGPEYDIEIVERHHRMKKDAPSGTALRLAEIAAEARGVELDKMSVYGRYGLTGPRKKGAIAIHALRGGDVVGEHVIEFMAAGDQVSLVHKATSRDAFAGGALLAARFVSKKKQGLWSMQDVLDL